MSNVIVIVHIASGERDFVAHSMDLTFGPGNTQQTVMITIIDDLHLEHDEQFNSIVSLTVADSSVDIDPADASITIFDNDSELYARLWRTKRMRGKRRGAEAMGGGGESGD